MNKVKKYVKPVISRIRLNPGEAIMKTCSSGTAKTTTVSKSQQCQTATTCNVAVS